MTTGNPAAKLDVELYEQATTMARAGRPQAELEKFLRRHGLSAPEAEAAAATFREMAASAAPQASPSSPEDSVRAELRARGHKNMLVGGLWCGGGTLVTVLTYSAARGGGSYVVAWGAILVGGIQFCQGVIQTFSASRD